MDKKRRIASWQSDLYREGYYKMLNALLVSISLILVLMGVMIYLILSKPVTHYYASTPIGKNIPMVPKG